MENEFRHEKKTELAQAIARGAVIARWALKNQVSRATAFRWASEPEVRREVEACRRRELDRALGRLASLSGKAAAGIARLAAGAESESVQLRACGAILADQMAVSRFSGLENRMVEIEEYIRDRAGQTDQTGQRAPGNGLRPA